MRPPKGTQPAYMEPLACQMIHPDYEYETIRRFLALLGHPVALVGRKPVAIGTPTSMVLWPAKTDDPADSAVWLSYQYHSVYCNLNPLATNWLEVAPAPGIGIRRNMIARRTRLLIDIDAKSGDKEEALRRCCAT